MFKRTLDIAYSIQHAPVMLCTVKRTRIQINDANAISMRLSLSLSFVYRCACGVIVVLRAECERLSV